MGKSYFDESENWKKFELESKEFLKKMDSVSDYYKIIISRSEGHKMAVKMGVKENDFQWHAKSHVEEYIHKYKANLEEDFYPDGLQLREKNFSYIYTEFIKLFKVANELNVNIPTPMYYDYCSSAASLLGVQLAIKEIKKLEE